MGAEEFRRSFDKGVLRGNGYPQLTQLLVVCMERERKERNPKSTSVQRRWRVEEEEGNAAGSKIRRHHLLKKPASDLVRWVSFQKICENWEQRTCS